MASERIDIITNDGVRIATDLFVPAHNHNGVTVQINGATGVPRQYYRRYAEYLCGRGFSVATYDYRGVGESKDPDLAGDKYRLRYWGQRDLPAVATHLCERFPNNRLMAVGHSVGGQLLALAPRNHLFSGALFVASQVGYWRNWALRHQPRMWLIWHVIFPLAAKLFGYLPGRISGAQDLPYGIGMEWARWARSPHYFVDDKDRPLAGNFHGFAGPMRLVAITDDALYAPLRAMQDLGRFYPEADIGLVQRSPQDYGLKTIGHFGFFRKDMPETAWAETADWLLDKAHGDSAPYERAA